MSSIIFLTVIFLLPTQLGRHFWPAWSLVNGIRVDYLAPTIYVTDILIVILFLLSFFRRGEPLSGSPHGAGYKPAPTMITAVLLGIVILGNHFSLLSLIKLIKIIEIFIFAYLVKIHLTKKIYPQFIFVLSLSLLFQSGLAIAQFFNHGSLNGIFYWFGERNFSGSTPGIANASINGALILRSYGTFPHPNVLAGFLLVGTIVIANYFGSRFSVFGFQNLVNQFSVNLFKLKLINRKLTNPYPKTDLPRGKAGNRELRTGIFFFFVLLLSSLALFLTLSRVAIGLGVGFVIYYFCRGRSLCLPFASVGRPRGAASTVKIVMIVVAIAVFFIFLSPRFLSIFGEDKQSYEARVTQSQIALAMFRDHPLTGVGLNQYLVELPKYMKITSFKDYQPTHNVYLLILAETGLTGAIVILLYCYIAIKKIVLNNKTTRLDLARQVKQYNNLILILIIFILGLFDHYFYTLQQGNLMMGLILGLTIIKHDR